MGFSFERTPSPFLCSTTSTPIWWPCSGCWGQGCFASVETRWIAPSGTTPGAGSRRPPSRHRTSFAFAASSMPWDGKRSTARRSCRPGPRRTPVADEVTAVSATLGPIASTASGAATNPTSIRSTRLEGDRLHARPLQRSMGPVRRRVHASVPEVNVVGPSDCLLQTIDGFAVPFASRTCRRTVAGHPALHRGFGGPQQTIELLLSVDPLVPDALASLGRPFAAISGAPGSASVRRTRSRTAVSPACPTRSPRRSGQRTGSARQPGRAPGP